MIIHKIAHYVDYNQWLKRLPSTLKEPKNQNSIKAPKLQANE